MYASMRILVLTSSNLNLIFQVKATDIRVWTTNILLEKLLVFICILPGKFFFN